ncbi:MAG: DUF262 domain-containing protein [Rhodoferax sp.]|nr:DUF262 domain-containing protein [Betaproteobacteria bacterium]NCN96004.1 DUF262 domain-containing protein [Rhodoferax sp.]OIP19892.1 MAG: hypothetical protein AUK50_04025 [Comamonadaceae bacterium CG2_30_57_122]PIZ23432.1 MAG: hypothetical protein COY49_03350 [Comamonadaceae bacterium CG_4_10_14_0_8_um_filter_57_29]PJC16380.1 MAG: hypothetical protein CO065_10405 [Comamonadaceae bacterium CG_4_9_14_0_8_um_filter_57_21]
MTTKPNAEIEEIEGLANEKDDVSLGGYPIDTLLIRNENRTVHDVLRRIAKGSFVMNPDFQRDFIWQEDKQSKLIESVLMRIPLPVFYLGEDEEGRMVVVDGLQRLSTFQRFVNNEFPLKLPDQAELNKRYFRDLSPKMQNRIEDCNLILYVIDAKVPEQARLDIFDRVNGGVPLTRQQMRNCLYMGAATRFLKEEATTKLFIKTTGGSLKTAPMRDREFVNRFCAFRLLPLPDYRGDMDDFLARGLKIMNKLSPDALQQLRGQFHAALKNNLAVFGQHSFRKHTHIGQGRSILNASLWDVMTTVLSEYSESTVEAKASSVRAAFFALMNDDDFITAITYGTNDPRKVAYRFKTARSVFKEALNA